MALTDCKRIMTGKIVEPKRSIYGFSVNRLQPAICPTGSQLY